MRLTLAADITPGTYVLGENRGEVAAVDIRGDQVRLTFHVGAEVLHVVKGAAEEVAVRS